MPVVVVTGASHGIGRAIALSFASEDQARLVLVSRNEEKLADVADECARRGAEKQNSFTTTSAMSGEFHKSPTRAEFMRLIRLH